MSEQVRLMFSDISESYDLGNDVLSLGMHRLWKKKFVKVAGPKSGDRVLDVATGTGDIATIFAKKVGKEGEVVGVDFSPAMIARARSRAKNLLPNLRFESGDALDLRFASNTFDIASISFGIRNVDNPAAGLKEMMRTVKPGGHVAVLEFGQPSGLWGAFYRFYSRTLLPFLGGLISGNEEAYSYLDETSARFPSGEKFVALMREVGFVDIVVRPLLGGVAWIYVGKVG
ncbi:MAG: bifunctional demethylmenaquinone methyltransferase/2-methoxy-6-polyprenyl-1,4-benzoquinol methylase UbiE [Candidatus Kapaibacterium sp.]